MACRRYSLVFSGLVLSMVAVLACTKDIEKPNDFAQVNTGKVPSGGPDTEGGFPDSAKPDSGPDGNDGGVCNDLQVIGAQVDKIAVASDPPASTGGTVVEGTYDLNAYSQYVGISGVVTPLGITARMTLRIKDVSKTIDEVSEVTTGSAAPAVALTTGAYSITGSAFATSGVCPAGGGKSWQFTSNSLNQIILTDPATREAFTFLKRP